MAKTKFLIFPKKLFHPEPSPTSHLIAITSISFFSQKSWMPGSWMPLCLSDFKFCYQQTCCLYPQDTTRVRPLFPSCTAASLNQATITSCLYYCSGLLIGVLPPPFIPFQACLEIAVRGIPLKCRIWFDLSYILPQALCIPNPRNFCCSLFIPKHAHLLALALAVPLSRMLFPHVAT